VITELIRTTSRAPRWRLRGKRRYFRRIQREAQKFDLDLGPDSWWDLSHYHADWYGWGNAGWRYRRQHIQALARVFSTIAGRAEEFPIPFQSWIYLSCENAGVDATYLHSPNKNNSPFPFRPDRLDWENSRTSKLLAYFQELMPRLSLRVGEARTIDDSHQPGGKVAAYFIFSPQIGVPLDDADFALVKDRRAPGC
jgi:hypothetical protein